MRHVGSIMPGPATLEASHSKVKFRRKVTTVGKQAQISTPIIWADVCSRMARHAKANRALRLHSILAMVK